MLIACCVSQKLQRMHEHWRQRLCDNNKRFKQQARNARMLPAGQEKSSSCM
jgi:hypothetical protein